MVAARHLHFFGVPVSVFLPKAGKAQHILNLIKQMEVLKIPVVDKFEKAEDMISSFSKATFLLVCISLTKKKMRIFSLNLFFSL